MGTASGGGTGRLRFAVAAACLALAVHAPLLTNGFVNYDDPSYVTGNPHVLRGLRPASLAWALTHPLDGNWHPVTVLSHMADV